MRSSAEKPLLLLDRSPKMKCVNIPVVGYIMPGPNVICIDQIDEREKALAAAAAQNVLGSQTKLS
jgi:hypothetical protein